MLYLLLLSCHCSSTRLSPKSSSSFPCRWTALFPLSQILAVSSQIFSVSTAIFHDLKPHPRRDCSASLLPRQAQPLAGSWQSSCIPGSPVGHQGQGRAGQSCRTPFVGAKPSPGQSSLLLIEALTGISVSSSPVPLWSEHQDFFCIPRGFYCPFRML